MGTISQPYAANRRIFILILSFILLFALSFRLYGITNPVYDYCAWRQTETAALARNYVEDRLPFAYPEVDWVGPQGRAEMEFPLYPYLLSRLYLLFGVHEILGRLITILCALATAWALWDLGRRLFSHWIGLFAAAFFSAAPLAIYFGRTLQPDMMMVCFSTLAICALLRWNGELRSLYFYLSAVLFMFAIALKPPSLIVLFPMMWIIIKIPMSNWKRASSFTLYLLLVLIIPLLWYIHARTFFEETGASFMWHYKEFSIEKIFLSVYQDPQFWKTIAYRTGHSILFYIGMIPFFLGLIRSLSPMENRGFLWAWLFGILVLYLGMPGHHIGHDYYSLLAIPPIALTAAIGCEAIAARFHKWNRVRYALFAIPLLIATLGMYEMVKHAWYERLYYYYEDALDLRDEIPQDALILVMDEIAHTPEFFYFANRKGWHRMRDPLADADDSLWLEQKKSQGASVYVGLNENVLNHPYLYLQDHRMGNYIRSHYYIQEIGERHFVARLDRPIYGNNLLSFFRDKVLAVSENLIPAAKEKAIKVLPLSEWYLADMLVMDYHSVLPDQVPLYRQIYEAALKDGYRIAQQSSGRLVLLPNQSIFPVNGLTESILSSSIEPLIRDDGRMVLGILNQGHYRISFHFSTQDLSAPVSLQVFKQNGEILAERILEDVHQLHLQEGERPEVFIDLTAPTGVFARAINNKNKIVIPLSVVCMPDVECIAQDMVIQVEKLKNHRTFVIHDQNADRNTAVVNQLPEKYEIMLFAPYFHFPTGDYEGIFRIRSMNQDDRAEVEIGLFDAITLFQEKNKISATDLRMDYRNFSIHAELNPNYALETRVYIQPHTQIAVDTIRLRHLRNDAFHPVPEDRQHLYIKEDQPYRIDEWGRMIDRQNQPTHHYWIASATVTGCAWNAKSGGVVIDASGEIWNEKGARVTKLPWDQPETIVSIKYSTDGKTLAILTQGGSVYLLKNSVLQKHEFPQLADPVQDLIVTNAGEVLVLYGNGEMRSSGNLSVPTGIPNFWANVCRSLLSTEGGVYVVDCNGAIHSSTGVEPVRSPVFRPTAWVRQAQQTKDRWVFLSDSGEIIEF